MISKRRFIEIMEELEDMSTLNKRIDDILKSSKNDNINRELEFYGIIDATSPIVIELLEYLFDDNDEIISWWIYEAEFGKNAEIYSYDEKDEKIDLSTAGKFYDYLVNELSNRYKK